MSIFRATEYIGRFFVMKLEGLPAKKKGNEGIGLKQSAAGEILDLDF